MWVMEKMTIITNKKGEIIETEREYAKLIYTKDSENYEEWWKYNEQGKLICYKNSNEYKEEYKYDEQGNNT